MILAIILNEQEVLKGFEEKVKESFQPKKRENVRLLKEIKDILEKMKAADEIKTASLLVP